MAFSVETVVILLVSVAIIVANVLMLLVLFRTDMLAATNKYFFTSLVAADLCIGLFYAPFSFWASLFDRWIYGENFCHIEAYLAAILWVGSIYSLTWLSIDHHVAARKSDRYESLMTPMRSACWVALLWVAAVSFCCPSLFGMTGSYYYSAAYVCVVDWRPQRAYVLTSAVLIIVPPLVTLAVSNLYMFTADYRAERAAMENSAHTNARSDRYFIVFLISIGQVCTWLPICSLQLTEAFYTANLPPTPVGAPPPAFDMLPQWMHFYFMWLAISNSLLKFILYVLFDHNFRVGLAILYSKSCCKCTKIELL